MSGTFHALALKQIKQRSAEIGRSNPAIISSQYQFLKRNLPKEFDSHINSLLNEFGWASSQLIDAHSYTQLASAAHRKPSIDVTQVAELLEKYQQLKLRKHVMDLDDIIRRAISDISSDDSYAAAIHWRHRHFFVDEFQDINPLQYELLSRWRQQRNDIFVVGDPAQSIYSWNGSDPELINDFADMNPASQVIKLTKNYRSSSQILAAAKAILPSSLDLSANKPDGEIVEIVAYNSDEDEVNSVTAQATRALRFDPLKTVAILARTQKQLKMVTEALSELGYDAELLVTDRTTTEKQINEDKIDYDTDSTATKKRPTIPLGTFHSAKGLEWDTVFVIGAEEGYTPSAFATSKAQIEEEQRLLYVACTRAKRKLVITWAKTRSFNKSTKQRNISRFLSRVKQSQIPGKKIDREMKISDIRAVLGTSSTQTQKTRLQHWRSKKAKVARVGESAIMSDQLLAQIAESDSLASTEQLIESQISVNRRKRYLTELSEVLNFDTKE